VRSGLVLVQVSLSFVLLVGAGLLMQSLLKVRTASPGFNTRGVQDTAIDLVSAATLPRVRRPFRTRCSSVSARCPAWSPPPSRA